MTIKTGIWVVVADGNHGVVFKNEGTVHDPNLKTLRVYNLVTPPIPVQSGTPPPSASQYDNAGRPADEAPDLDRLAKDRFIERIVADIEADAARGAFNALAVVAPPAAIDHIRKVAKEELSKRVIAWIEEELTHDSVPVIAQAVARALNH